MKIRVRDESYELDVQSITNKEAMALERVTGMTFGEWSGQLSKGSTTAMTALVWLAQRRTTPGLRFDDVEYAFGDLSVETPEAATTGAAPDPTEVVSGTSSPAG